MLEENVLIELDKKYVSLLLKSISALSEWGLNEKLGLDIANCHLSISNGIRDGKDCYTVRFYDKKFNPEKWRDGYSPNSINLDIDIKTNKILKIYGER